MVRSIIDYKILLRDIQARKQNTPDNDRARLLCRNLLKREIPRDELARRNDKNNKKCQIPQINREVIHAIFQQAKLQFPEFTDWYTDHKCKTVEVRNDGCKLARQEIKGQLTH